LDSPRAPVDGASESSECLAMLLMRARLFAFAGLLDKTQRKESSFAVRGEDR
jgi:hypothetical protein